MDTVFPVHSGKVKASLPPSYYTGICVGSGNLFRAGLLFTKNETTGVKVTHVALRPTEAAEAADRPSLTPELMASVGARYSRNNDGLDAILELIDKSNLDASVDRILRFVDYGHQSIADMAPIALFIDGISLWMAYYLWTLCPVAGGQESSTRYIRLSGDGLVSPEMLGLPDDLVDVWQNMMQQSFATYEAATEFWQDVSAQFPELTRIPASLLADPSDKAQKQVARMRRNFAFDRARYFLPVAAKTNVCLIQSARAWVTLVQYLSSHPLREAKLLAEALRGELALVAPRLLRHATVKPGLVRGLRAEFETLVHQISIDGYFDGALSHPSGEAAPEPLLDVHTPGFKHYNAMVAVAEYARDATAEKRTVTKDEMESALHNSLFAEDLAFHDNRYGYIGESLRRTSVRFGWRAVAFAEIRDLNRHRTGTKYCPPLPVGFYHATDQLPEDCQGDDWYRNLSAIGDIFNKTARELLASGQPSYVYFTLLGTQYPFEHTTTADKFLYEAELRTGVGSHYRYAQHLHDVLALWYEKFPSTKGLILEGEAEPE